MSSLQTSANLDAVFAHIATNESAFIDRLVAYLRQPSISTQNVGIDETAEYLRAVLTGIGLSVEVVPTARNPVVVGRWEYKPGAPTILLYGHYDVQPPEPLDAWTTPPFEPSIRDGRIYARGVGDNKGQHFAQILAIESWLTATGTLPCNVIIMLDGEEEIGSPSLPGFVRDYARNLQADVVVTADGSMHVSGRPIIQFGVRGVVTFELRVKHANRDLHSGNYGGVAPNPIWTLVHLLATMKNADGEITIDGVLDKVIPPTAMEHEAIGRLPENSELLLSGLGLHRFDAPLERSYFDRLMFHPTLTINGLHGGYGGEGVKTVLPSEAMVKCDMRLVEAQDPQEVIDLVAAHVRRHAPEVEMVPLMGMPPSKTPLDSPFAGAIQRAIVDARGVEPLLYPVVGGSLPDHVFSKILGLPIFLVPYANADQANHAPNENMLIDCFFSGIRTGAAILSHVARQSS